MDYDKDILGLDTKVRFAGDCDDTREIRFALIYREGSLSMDKEGKWGIRTMLKV